MMKKENLTKGTNIINIMKSGHHRFGKPILLSLVFAVLLMTLSGCLATRNLQLNSNEESEEIVLTDDYFFPVIWINGSSFRYQPLYGNKTQGSGNDKSEFILPFSNSPIPFLIESTQQMNLSYIITDSKKNILDSGTMEGNVSSNNAITTFEVAVSESLKVEQGKELNLEMTIQIGNSIGYYHVKLLYNAEDKNNLFVNRALDSLKEEMKGNEISFLGEPRIWLDIENQESCLVQIEYTGAKRLEEGFEYRDYKRTYKVDTRSLDSQLEKAYSIEKQRYYYNQQVGGWYLGEQEFTDADMSHRAEERYLTRSPNGRFEIIMNNQEMFLYDQSKEKLSEVYRLDSFDSDYVYDEYNHHKLELLSVTDEGKVYFAVLGYINDSSELSQKSGMAFYEYSEGKRRIISFMEDTRDYLELDQFFKNNSYYSKTTNTLYFFVGQMLYSMDLENGKLDSIESFLNAKLYSDEGVLVWQGNSSKYNGAIFLINLDSETLKVENLYQTGIYKRLLGVSEDKIIVGRYQLEDTYEYLNQEVVYPYEMIEIYDYDGNLITTLDHMDYGADTFFGDVYVDESTGSWECDLIVRKIDIKENAKSSRIYFVALDQTLQLVQRINSTSENNEQRGVNSNAKIGYSKGFDYVKLSQVYPDNRIETRDKKDTIIYLSEPSNIENQIKALRFDEKIQKNLYKLVSSSGDEVYGDSFIDVLIIGKEIGDFEIYQSLTDGITSQDKLLFDTNQLLSKQYLDDVKVISQRPELPRGCEVTSLAMLLDYYMDFAPDKLTLANKLTTSTIEYKINNGFVNYSDMNVEFAGSMSDTSLPGLGVYIDPIKELASKYTDLTPTNVTGMSFEQLLTFVSREQPVLVIIPNRYQAVQDYSIEVWKTSGGYMEVTYQEHSVVVIGFDDKYVFYSDPSKGIIDKKTLKNFKEAWESMGNQALVIVE